MQPDVQGTGAANGTPRTATTHINWKRIIWLALVAVILLFPLATDEANRDLCKGSAADEGDCAGQLPARRAANRKFKFHKIERLDDDIGQEVAENGSQDADLDVNEEDASDTERQSEQNGEINSADNDNDDNVGDDDDNKNDDDDDDNPDDNESEDGNEDEDDGKTDTDADDDDDDDDDDDGDDDDNDVDDEGDEEPSFLSKVLGMITGDDESDTRKVKDTDKSDKSQYPKIINWLHWLTEQTDEEPAGTGSVKKQKSKQKEKVAKDDTDWFTYLKRWPFNSIYPDSPDPASRRKELSSKPRKESPTGAKRAGTGRRQERVKNEEYMELLIHSLPAFIGNVAQVKSGECHQQLELLHRQLRAHKLWTLQMLDATGKIGTGLLRGNVNQFGDFDQCIQVATSIKNAPGKPTRVQGKYCLAQIEMRTTTPDLKDALHLLHGRGLWHAHLKNPNHFVPRYTIANWGICLPHACSAHVVHSIIETSLRPYNDTGIEFHIDVQDEHCTTKKKKSFSKLLSKDNNLAMGIFCIVLIATACILSAVLENWDWINAKLMRPGSSKSAETDKTEEGTEAVSEANDTKEQTQAEALDDESFPPLHLRVLNAFSPARTWQALVSLEANDVEFPLVHILKILATLMIYVNLKFIMAGHLPLTNRDAFVGTVNQYWSLAYRVPLLYSDLLLLLSGFLVAHKLSQQMEDTCRLSFLRNVATKACRYVPSILAVLGFQAWILPHLGTGPLWHLLVGENARLCEQNMWRTALSIQNTGDVEEMCSPLTVQLSLDMQLYFLGALVVWLYFTDPEAGFFLCGAFHALSVAARYSRTQREHLAPSLFHGIHVSKFYRTANLIYSSPITRATTYLLGIGAGLLYRSESGSFGIPIRFKRAGWTLAMIAIGWCFWSCAAGMRSKYVYRSTDAASYLAWSPLLLGLGVCWCILMAPLDKSFLQRYPNLARIVLLLSRIEIPLQLASYVVVLWNTASAKESHQFQLSDLLSLQELVWIMLFALLVAFLIDFPAQQLGLLALEFNFSDPLLLSNAKANATNENGDNPKSESPEPIESIWPSDTEPEDDKSSE